MSCYKTIETRVEEIIFKEKKSKFIGFAYPFQEELEAKSLIENLRKLHPQARHVCYAYRTGIHGENHRTFDDGEPNNSAGSPIYGQIMSFGVTYVLVAVVRYFGGVKLGVGGLVSAYKITAQMTLSQAHIIEKIPCFGYKIRCGHKNLGAVQKIIKSVNGELLTIETVIDCNLKVSIPQSEESTFIEYCKALFGVELTKD